LSLQQEALTSFAGLLKLVDLLFLQPDRHSLDKHLNELLELWVSGKSFAANSRMTGIPAHVTRMRTTEARKN
jgi:hypothetical protein